MAVLRGGRRIGNFDIRVGLPRDRSLIDIHKDPRLQRQPGGAGVLQRFQSQINQGEGFARPNRYVIRLNLPNNIAQEAINRRNDPMAIRHGTLPAANNDLESKQTLESINMMCNAVTLPNRDINTVAHRTYGPKREMPYAYSFSGQIECSFYADKFLRQRLFFENWQKKIISQESHSMRFYDDYVGSMDILTLGQFDAKQDDDARVTYAVRLSEVYPQTIGSIEYSYGADEQTIVPITLNFRTWINLTMDQVNNATTGKSLGDVPTIKAGKDFGLFGGLLGKLPPELRRAGRDALQVARRSLPIGKVTGGRLFPPFG
jgi:hypothetical protein|tara:strand:- start:234 stop:1184 length:951 start_codon:yes stop_codon:yes gene_type:complete